MSIKISSLVWEHYPAGGSELLTALAYADHAHDNGTNIRPSVAYIAKKTRQSERNVRRYLAQMRESGWLLTVRHGNGGRGFATEYRINPLWITNPAKLSPFAAEASETLKKQEHKDESKGSESLSPVSAQPPGTIKEPKTDPSKHLQPLSFPDELTGRNQAATQKLIQQCPANLRQLVLDEIANLIEAGKVRNPIGLLRKLVAVAQVGKFVPNTKARQQGPSNAEHTQDQELTPDKHAGRQFLNELQELLKKHTVPKKSQ